MSSISAMLVGQSQEIDVNLFGQDNVNNPSQVVDLATPLVVSAGTPTLGTIMVKPGTTRTLVITAVAPGTAFFRVDTSTPLVAANAFQFAVPIIAPPPDNRRIDFVTARPPV